MTTFNPGDKVAFRLNRADHTGMIRHPECGDHENGYLIDGDQPFPGPWFSFADGITAIPADAPILMPNTRVQVAADAPHHAGRTGYVEELKVSNDMFGYWIRVAPLLEIVWVPAAALTVFEGGE